MFSLNRLVSLNTVNFNNTIAFYINVEINRRVVVNIAGVVVVLLLVAVVFSTAVSVLVVASSSVVVVYSYDTSWHWKNTLLLTLIMH